VIIIDHGRILYDGGLAQLKQRVGGGSSLVFQLLHPAAARASGEAGGDPDQASPLLDALRRRTGEADVSWSIEQEGAVRATFDAARVSRAEVIRSVLERVEVADIAFVDARIDDVIRRIYAGALGKAAR
jgi:ABC-2 type transport system ATP-binding protein